jgi:hypothetical protein
MARRSYVVPLTLLSLFCVISLFLTTDFKDAQPLIKETTVPFQGNKANIDLATTPAATTVATTVATTLPTTPATTASMTAATTLTTTATTTSTTATANVITWKGLGTVDRFVGKYKFCEATMQERNKARPFILNITFGCHDLFSKSGGGTGNWIAALLVVRLAASVLGDVNVQMTCPDAVKEQTSLIIPWLMGSFPSRGGASRLVSDQSRGIRGSGSESGSISKISNTVPVPTTEEACGNFHTCPFGHMLPDLRYELRRMAVALVGVPHVNHPAAAFAERYLWNEGNDSIFSNNTMQLSVPARGEPPLIPGVVLDDVVINFRGGDLFNSRHGGYGFMKFSAFSNRIPPNTKSIGIVTQPFDISFQQRGYDATHEKLHRHRVVVMALVDFLQEKFPQARVTIHNGRTETIALAYARMVMANQTMVGITSFGVFPGISSFGTGYIRKPIPKGPNIFLMNPPIDQLADNVILMDDPDLLMAPTVREIFLKPTGQEIVLEWFKNDTYCNGLASLVCFFPLNSTV